jgi:SAM-dependent methyltransferase
VERQVIAAQQSYWNKVYQDADQATATSSGQPHWLDIVLEQAQIGLSGRILELGCGRGYDSAYLVRAGCRVVGLDLSHRGLQDTAAALPMVHLVQAAMPDPLPFRAECFDAAVAGLSLHYYLWEDTLAIIHDIRRVLGPGRLLVFRVNSVDDVAHGYGQGDEIEPRLFARNGRYKRFFTEADCRLLFDKGWRLLTLCPFTETRYGDEKPTWAGVARTL